MLDKKDTEVSILGTMYSIKHKNSDDSDFSGTNLAGVCNVYTKTISLCIQDYDRESATDLERITAYKATLRHEVIHAFIYESGLDGESTANVAWAVNEEIIDWIALQSPKIFSVFQKLDIL